MTFFPLSIRQVSNPLETTILVDITSALIAHACFRKFEAEDITGGLARYAIFATSPVVIAVLNFPSHPWLNGLLHLGLFTCFLLSSIALYRISPFHPMAKYPGPVIGKISKFWMAYLFHKGKVHIYLKELHERYGSIVRIGPNELSIINVDLIPHILGFQGMPKGPMWEGRQPTYIKNRKTGGNIASLRDAELHAKIRKPWTRAFGPGPLRDYEDALVARAKELVQYLKENCQNSPNGIGRTDMMMRISYFSLDLMGDTAFGESFQFMRDGDPNGSYNDIQTAMFSVAVTMAVPWASGLTRLFELVGFKRGTNGQFSKLALGLARRRIQNPTGKRDLFYHLAANMDVLDEKLIISNAGFGVLAGSDTTSSVLCGILYYLLRHPDYLRRLREEIDQAYPPSEHAEIQIEKLANLELLNAVINETLRLQPAFLSYMQRAPAENSGGRRIGDIFIPERTAVIVPPYVIQRIPAYFSPRPDEFWPERWFNNNSTSSSSENEKVILNRSAFIPFSMGPAGCAGKPLALSQLRYITTLLVYNFELDFDDGYRSERWEEELLDKFMVVKGALPLKLRVRPPAAGRDSR